MNIFGVKLEENWFNKAIHATKINKIWKMEGNGRWKMLDAEYKWIAI